ncbi:MAG: hypothetical protein HYZ11_04090 [Candidatus Tectomicrobia bacterium]|uniref:DSBA-like thioredoxin domain-containing protein n=1 Tax=Tectimicrobiota bacterium TaxID=2528274 RepID=A0A932HZ12_UNCTE|nr:hypothetical protein [Candidatus Tectomicrobia bacterium]
MPEFEGGLVLKWRAFPLEVINGRPAPRHIVDQEWPLVAVQEPLAPCRPFPHEGFLRTTMPAFEAYAAAYDRDPARARRFDLALRRGFFHEGRRIDEPEVVLEIAGEAGLDPEALRPEVGSPRRREQVMADCRESMRLRDEKGLPMTSPTLMLPSGEAIHNPYASPKRFERGRLVEVLPPPRCGEAVYEGFREILRKAAG